MNKTDNLNKKNLLIITNGYPCREWKESHTFVKGQVDELKKYFNKIYVLSQNPYFPKILANLPKVPKLYKNYTLPKNYKYDNVEVYFVKYLTLPEGMMSKIRGDSLTRVIKKIIKKHNIKFDLIHAHFIWPSGYAAVKLKEKYGKKVVITGHGYDVYVLPFKSGFWQKNITKILEKADRILTVSSSNNKKIKELGFNAKIIPNGFDNDLFYLRNKKAAKKELNTANNKKIILNVGALRQVKNQKNLIRACADLKKLKKEFVCYIIGDGDLKKELLNEIKKSNLSKEVKLIGPKPHDEIPKWMNASDLFVFPSYTESFGVVNIEALACGTPVVSTINGGSEGILTSEDYGFLLKNPDDYKGLAELINKALNKKWNTQKLITHSKQYQFKNVINSTLKEYKKLMP